MFSGLIFAYSYFHILFPILMTSLLVVVFLVLFSDDEVVMLSSVVDSSILWPLLVYDSFFTSS